MVRFYCPGCWAEFGEDLVECPNCGLNIGTFFASKDYLETLILALNHPDKTTPLRAAWILGKLRNPLAIEALIAVVEKTEDVYLSRATIRAWGEIWTGESADFLNTICNHPSRMIRDAAQDTLRQHLGESTLRSPGQNDRDVP